MTSATAAVCLFLVHSKSGKVTAFVPANNRISQALLRESGASVSFSSSPPPSSATALHLFGFSWDNDMEVQNPKDDEFYGLRSLQELIPLSLQERGYLDDVVQRLQRQVKDLMILSSLFETPTSQGSRGGNATPLALSATAATATRTFGRALEVVQEDEEEAVEEERQEQTATASTPPSSRTNESSRRRKSLAVAETLMREATAKVEDFWTEASSVLSTSNIEDVVLRAGSALALLEDVLEQQLRQADATGGLELLQAAISQQDGVNQETVDFMRMANGVLNRGYVDDRLLVRNRQQAEAFKGFPTTMTPPLMHNFPSVRLLSIRRENSENHKKDEVSFTDECQRSILTAATMANLAGGIYENTEEKTHASNHAFVTRGMTEDVAWMVTDSIGYEEDFRAASQQPEEENNGAKTEEFQKTGDRTISGRDPFNFAIGRITLNNNNNTKKSEQRSTRKSPQVATTNPPTLVRTLTIRGFDASDDTVDRERLLDRTCNACPEPLVGIGNLAAPRGLLGIAKAIYKELRPHLVDHLAPTQKIVLNGHSIGGSLSVLVLLLMTQDLGAEWVKDRVLKVFTFGAPPVVVTTDDEGNVTKPRNAKADDYSDHGPPVKDQDYQCSILNAAGLPASMVYSYVQPWDPIPRLFSEIDPLYPLVGDLGEDGKTLYASGPSRTLRVVTRAITEVWEGWPRFRDNFRNCANQEYRNVGIVHVLMPDRLRYVTDRLASVRVGVPSIDQVLRVPSDELYEVMLDAFPMDTFRISYVPDAVRGFVHHFFPAYDPSLNEFAARLLSSSSLLEQQEGQEEALTNRGEDMATTEALVAEPVHHEEGAWM